MPASSQPSCSRSSVITCRAADWRRQGGSHHPLIRARHQQIPQNALLPHYYRQSAQCWLCGVWLRCQTSHCKAELHWRQQPPPSHLHLRLQRTRLRLVVLWSQSGEAANHPFSHGSLQLPPAPAWADSRAGRAVPRRPSAKDPEASASAPAPALRLEQSLAHPKQSRVCQSVPANRFDHRAPALAKSHHATTLWPSTCQDWLLLRGSGSSSKRWGQALGRSSSLARLPCPLVGVPRLCRVCNRASCRTRDGGRQRGVKLAYSAC